MLMRLIFATVLLSILSACNTTKSKQDQQRYTTNLMILLKEGAPLKSIVKSHDELKFSKSKLSSKSQNLYFTTVDSPYKSVKELIEVILANELVVECYQPDQLNPSTNSTNVKSAKTKPIKK